MITLARPIFGKVAMSITASIFCMLLCITTPIASSAQGFSSIYSFCAQAHCPDGNLPNGWLVQGNDGNFYGTTATGGASGYGTIFRITPAGQLTTLHSFNNTD